MSTSVWSPLKALAVALLLSAVLLTTGCESSPSNGVPEGLACLGEAVVLIGTVVVTGGADAPIVPAVIGTVVGTCTTAGALLISNLLKDNSQQVEVYTPKAADSPFTLQHPVSIPNCAPGAVPLQLNYEVQVSIPKFLQIGSQLITSRPDDAATDSQSLIARGLDDKLSIHIGQMITGYAKFSISLAPGTKASVQLNGTVVSQVGTAEVKQGDNVLVPLIAWRYPTDVKFAGDAAQISTTAC